MTCILQTAISFPAFKPSIPSFSAATLIRDLRYHHLIPTLPPQPYPIVLSHKIAALFHFA